MAVVEADGGRGAAGGGATYVNASASVFALSPPAVLTTTPTVPAPCGGLIAVTSVLEMHLHAARCRAAERARVAGRDEVFAPDRDERAAGACCLASGETEKTFGGGGAGAAYVNWSAGAGRRFRRRA